jgi:hypothetical protein
MAGQDREIPEVSAFFKSLSSVYRHSLADELRDRSVCRGCSTAKHLVI